MTGAYGVFSTPTMANEVSDEATVERTVQTAQAFRGLEDDNVVVYRRVPITRWNGTITESSTGIGIGEPTSVDLTDGHVVTTATNVGALAAQYPGSTVEEESGAGPEQGLQQHGGRPREPSAGHR